MTGSVDHPTSSDHEQLVAYLDCELTPDEARQVEQRLSHDDAYRQLLSKLQEAWDMLDELPQPTPNDGFVQTTVEMVAVRMSKDVDSDQEQWRLRRYGRRATQVAALAASLALGFWGVSYWQDRPNRELLEDFPVIERVDLYQQIDDLAYLVSLADDGMFTEALNEEPSVENP